ncbi:hypothetical protein L3X39_06010 [Sabulilitoribacter multivorans]|uniref:Uncharacterized protein n=1 Tax=Flaviramulus multivorans TaxID=1304750 RepID=A0ABS9IHG0_9FLAO|nr:hypothetical protein [Flaviramulus multivorans]MCF7560187.1 hypothetical protein [Flaviramulus multivorans]
MRKAVYLVLISVLILGCKKDVNKPQVFDYGTIENGVYSNTFFGFKLPVNDTWYVLNNDEANNVYKEGNKIAAGDNSSLKEILSASDINLAKLFTAFREEPGTSMFYNPSLLINAENLNNAANIKSTSDYLREAKKILNQTQMQIQLMEEKENVKIGSQNFGYIKLKNTFEEQDIIQDYYVTIKNGFALAIIMSYVEEEGKNEVYTMFDALEI